FEEALRRTSPPIWPFQGLCCTTHSCMRRHAWRTAGTRQVHARTHTRKCTHTQTCSCTHAHTNTQPTFTHTHTHTDTHTHTHTRTHAHTHTNSFVCSAES